MKALILSSLFLTASAFAAPALQNQGMSPEKMTAIVQDVKAFKASCLETLKVTDVKEINIKNKTDEVIDKTAFLNAVNKDLGLTLKNGSKNTLTVDLTSTSSEFNKVKTTNYKLNLVLNDSTKDVCKNAYGKEFKETRQ